MTSPVQTEFACPYCHSKNLETVGACMHECLMACRDCGAQMTGAFVDDDILSEEEMRTGWYEPRRMNPGLEVHANY